MKTTHWISVWLAGWLACSSAAFASEPLTRHGRYTLETLGPPRASLALLDAPVHGQFGPGVRTVGAAVQAVLVDSGYRFATAPGETSPLHRLALPRAHRNLTGLTVAEALRTLAGPAYTLLIDESRRWIGYQALTGAPPTQLAHYVPAPGHGARLVPVARRAEPVAQTRRVAWQPDAHRGARTQGRWRATHRSAQGERVTTVNGDTLGALVRGWRPAGVSLQQAMMAVAEANPHAFHAGNINALKPAVVLRRPDASSFRAMDDGRAKRAVLAQWNAYQTRGRDE